jgi:ubiquinone/menaquinone biosynthesis C-methylase UbiE
MLPRILEPEVMDTAADALEYDTMDFTAVNQRFADEALAVLPASGTVLDLGTGTARIPMLMARQAPGLRLIAVDLSQAMLDLAARHLAAAGLQERITLLRADAKRLPLPPASCAGIVSNSIIHHLPDPAPCFAEIARLAVPGAALFLRDLARPSDRATLDHLVRTYAGDCNAYQQRLFAESLHAALTLDEVEALAHQAGLTDYRLYASSDRHWTLARPAR